MLIQIEYEIMCQLPASTKLFIRSTDTTHYYHHIIRSIFVSFVNGQHIMRARAREGDIHSFAATIADCAQPQKSTQQTYTIWILFVWCFQHRRLSREWKSVLWEIHSQPECIGEVYLAVAFRTSAMWLTMHTFRWVNRATSATLPKHFFHKIYSTQHGNSDD